MRGRAWMVALLCLGVARAVPAANTQFWTLETPEDFLKFRTHGVAVGGRARAELAPQLDTVGTASEPVLWSVAAEGGAVFVGSGHDGRIFRSQSGGPLQLFATTGEPEVLSLVADGKGGVYAGTGPHGRVMHVDRAGKVSLLAELKAEYVWALCAGHAGELYAATGASGKVFRIPATGAAEEWWSSPAGHTLCLAWGPTGKLLVGGEEEGILYEVSGKGQGRALFDSAEHEIRSVAVTASGDIYVAALRVQLQLPGAPAPGGAGVTAAGSDKGSRSVLYRLLPNGAGTRVWEGSGLIYSMLAEGRGVLMALGDDSQVWRYDPEEGAVRLAEPDGGSLQAMVRDARGVWIAGSNPGRLFRLGSARAAVGDLESTVLDGRRVARWGTLVAQGEALGSTRFQVRSGNSATPDAGWSTWQDYASGNVPAPAARFLQWKASLVPGARLRRVRVAWREQNLAPEVRGVWVLPQEPKALLGPPEGGASVTQTLATGVKVEYSLPRSTTRSSSFDVSAWARGIRTLRWEASDPNSDPLRYRVEVRPVGSQRWLLLDPSWEEQVYAWETTSVPDGEYEVRITASDSAGNTPSEAREASRISEPCSVDHTPPQWSAASVSRGPNGLRLHAVARDERSPLVYLAWSLDGGSWVLAEPVDGVVDSLEETVEADVSAAPGAHTLMLKAVDLSGNVGTARLDVR